MKTKEFKDVPLSESNVSLKLSLIQQRCAELLADSDSGIELTLEEAVPELDNSNPYSRG